MRTLPPRHFTKHSPPPPGRPEEKRERERESFRLASYPFAEAEDAVDEDDGRRRCIEDDGRGAPELVALTRRGDVDERSPGRARRRGGWPAQ